MTNDNNKNNVSANNVLRFPTRLQMAARVADLIEARLAAAIAETGAASIAVSGGSTPAALYAELSRREINWAKVTAVLVDERWVSPGASGSNEDFVIRTLKQNRATQLNVVGMWSDVPQPADGLGEMEKRLTAVKQPFDVVVLGMGNDGHTASWFPNCDGLDRALCVAGPQVTSITAKQSDVTGDHLERMTLTFGAMKDAKTVCLLLAGDDKLATFERAHQDGPVADMPVRQMLSARADLWACWAP